MKQKEPLYRKVNTKARGCHHLSGSEARYSRHTKSGQNRSMKQGVERGLDFTPLFRFLLSKVGKPWDEVYSEAKSRLPNDEAIWYMVIENQTSDNGLPYFKYEKSYFSKLEINENGILCFVNPYLKAEHFSPTCPCCTHTFNGKPFVKKYNYETISNNLQL